MNKFMVRSLLVCCISLLIAGGCKQQETKVDNSDKKTDSGKKNNSDTGTKTTDKKSTKSANGEKLVDVPDGIRDYVYKPYESLTLTADQKAKADDLMKQRGAELKELRQRRTELLEKDNLRQKRTDAIQKAKAAGTDVAAAERAAVGDAVFTQLEEISNAQNKITGEMRQAVKGVLTKEQIKQLNNERKGK